jgi:hypothetical protein
VTCFLLKALISAALVAAVSEVARRHPGFGGLIASLPLISILGLIWLWRETPDPARAMARHVLVRAAVAADVPRHPRNDAQRTGLLALYAFMLWAAPKAGVRL